MNTRSGKTALGVVLLYLIAMVLPMQSAKAFTDGPRSFHWKGRLYSGMFNQWKDDYTVSRGKKLGVTTFTSVGEVYRADKSDKYGLIPDGHIFYTMAEESREAKEIYMEGEPKGTAYYEWKGYPSSLRVIVETRDESGKKVYLGVERYDGGIKLSDYRYPGKAVAAEVVDAGTFEGNTRKDGYTIKITASKEVGNFASELLHSKSTSRRPGDAEHFAMVYLHVVDGTKLAIQYYPTSKLFCTGDYYYAATTGFLKAFQNAQRLKAEM